MKPGPHITDEDHWLSMLSQTEESLAMARQTHSAAKARPEYAEIAARTQELQDKLCLDRQKILSRLVPMLLVKSLAD